MVYAGSDVLGTDGPSIYAFRASDGGLVWQKAVSSSVDSCQLVHDGVLYTIEVGTSSQVETSVLALNARDGSVQWSYPLANYSEVENCAINDGLLYITTNDGLIHVLRTTDGTQIRSYSLGNERFFPIPPVMVLAP